MAAVVVAGFSTQLVAGRSSFASPLRVHVHAIAFMGWVAIFLTQSWFANRGSMALHRRLGWAATGWIALMISAALWVVISMARRGTVPFFFTPVQFLIGDPLTLLAFTGLTAAAIVLRRRTDWHARLHVAGMAAIMGPAFGRLLPLPLMKPFGLEASELAPLVFLAAGMVRDRRRHRRAHPAWLIGAGAIVGGIVLADLIAWSPLGDRIYRSVTAGYPGAAVSGHAYGAPPGSGRLTGR